MNNSALLPVLAASALAVPGVAAPVMDDLVSRTAVRGLAIPAPGNNGISITGGALDGNFYSRTQLFALSRYAGLRDGEMARASHLLAPGRARGVALAYDWGGITIEGATAGATPERDALGPPAAGWQSLARSARLSWRPLPGMVLRFSTGSWNRLDQLVEDGQMRRSSIAASYTKRITGGEWLTTFAWGRNAPRDGDSLYGYLAETSVRFGGAHLAFARLEQVSGLELMQSDMPSALLPERLRKASIGYYQDLMRKRTGRVGVGLQASRYLVPAAQARVFRDNPTSFMLFMRVDMR